MLSLKHREAGMRQRSPSPDGQGEQRELMATLLPGGEPVESLLRKAQFFTPGDPWRKIGVPY
jgi:hypothetical protein